MEEQSRIEPEEPREARLTAALRRVVLLKETGPKSAAWHRARVRTIWRLHALLAEANAARPEAPNQAEAPR